MTTIRFRPDADQALRALAAELRLNQSDTIRFALIRTLSSLRPNEMSATDVTSDPQAIGIR